MRKLYLFIAALFCCTYAQAQQPPAFFGNYYADQVGKGLYINTPSSIAGGRYGFSLAADYGAAAWGAGIGTNITNVQVVKAIDTLACSPISNGSAIAGKVALVYRGDCEFSFKALQAQNEGAIAVMIVNNIPGATIQMGAGINGYLINIPVFMVTKNLGDMIAAQLNNSQTVTISITPWLSGFSNDIGLISGGIAQSHAHVIPLSQLSGGTANAFEDLNAAYIGNFSTSTVTNVKMKRSIFFTPTGGGQTFISADSVTVPSFAPGDSIVAPISTSTYQPTASTTGRFDFVYTLSASQTDNNLVDNSLTRSVFVSDSVYSKGRYDLATMKPLSNSSRRLTTSSITAGPVFYNKNGNVNAKRVQFTVSDATGASLAGYNDVNVYLIKWSDGIVTSNAAIEGGELDVVGFGTKSFTSADISGQIFSADLYDVNGLASVAMDSNAWYWLVAAVPGQLFLGVDGSIDDNMYVRSYARENTTTGSATEYFAASIPGDDIFGFIGSFSDEADMAPFYSGVGSININDINFTLQKQNLLPAIALHVTPALSVMASATPACNGTSSGSISVSTQSGNAPYQFQLNGNIPQWGGFFSGLAAGTYQITVTDFDGKTGVITAIVPAVSVSVSISTTDATTYCSGSDSTLLITNVTAGSAVSYHWLMDGFVTQFTTDSIYLAKSTGTYAAIVMDTNFCADTSNAISILARDAPYAYAGDDTLVAPGTVLDLGGFPTADGDGPFTVSWTPTTGLDFAQTEYPVATIQGDITYYVTVTDVYGCVATDSIIIAVPNGIASVEENTLPVVVYPNPTSNMLHVSAGDVEDGEYDYKVINAAGKTVASGVWIGKAKHLEADLSVGSYTNGVYFLIINHGKDHFMTRVEKINK